MSDQENFVQELSQSIDRTLNGDVEPSEKKVGFILLLFPLGVTEGTCTITCNGLTKETVVEMMRIQADRLGGKVN